MFQVLLFIIYPTDIGQMSRKYVQKLTVILKLFQFISVFISHVG